jgi:F-type H+-transporting ATPase subunit h
VKQFSSPASPQAPAVPHDLASELSAYDAAEPTVASAPSTGSASSEENEGGTEQFLSFLEQDLPRKSAHH